ncbi:C69 family dipeptidase [Peptoniphilus duerdenii]|uniref:C69 family dipeptidase n=1 Tax=Peptoniphilus duerdenii TaxID=507750 RepID=UPI00288B852C|nr:C69 family dipeptidase [Peptoniphilus duerdenii]
MACTTLLVGKNASYDNSTIVTRSEDSGSGSYCAKRFIVVEPKDQPKRYKSVISECEFDLPENPLRYTAHPNADPFEGIWGCNGTNSKNVSMTATETITTNPRVLGADPLLVNTKDKKEGGLGEEDFVTVVLPYISSAREGVLRLGKLLEEHGTYESNGIAFPDENEIWWLETIGGHHWMARRVPDDAYVVMPNQLGIDNFDFKDAYGKKETFMCCEDLREFTEKNHLDLNLDGDFNPRLAYGSIDDSDRIYNTPRAWAMLRHFNPTSFIWDGEDADYRPEDLDLPWAMVPERKITVEDMKYVLSYYYQGTEFNPYGKDEKKGKYRPIGINRNNITVFTQIRPYKEDGHKVVEWHALGSNAFNSAVAQYANVTKTPAYFADDSKTVTTKNFYWTNRLIAALADANYHEAIVEIERYDQKIMSKSHEIIIKTDAYVEENKLTGEKLHVALEKANQELSDFTEEETNKLLDKVLYIASNHMKNSFSRSDN